jgi:hypothetical protein
MVLSKHKAAGLCASNAVYCRTCACASNAVYCRTCACASNAVYCRTCAGSACRASHPRSPSHCTCQQRRRQQARRQALQVALWLASAPQGKPVCAAPPLAHPLPHGQSPTCAFGSMHNIVVFSGSILNTYLKIASHFKADASRMRVNFAAR